MKRGFSLPELLAVMAVIVTLGALIVGGINVGRGNEISIAATNVMDQLALAREMAIAKNTPVECWFIRKPGTGMVSHLQICQINENGAATPARRLLPLATGTGIDTQAEISSLLSQDALKTWTPQAPQPKLPGFDAGYDCWSVRFTPDGTPMLAAETAAGSPRQWFLTIHSEREGNGLTVLPKNYAMISVAPMTGRLAVYRP